MPTQSFSGDHHDLAARPGVLRADRLLAQRSRQPRRHARRRAERRRDGRLRLRPGLRLDRPGDARARPDGVVATLTANVALVLPGVSISGGTFTAADQHDAGAGHVAAAIPGALDARQGRGPRDHRRRRHARRQLRVRAGHRQLSPQAPPGTLPPKIDPVRGEQRALRPRRHRHGHGRARHLRRHAAGIAGQLEATVTAPFLTGTFGVAINTTMRAVSEQLGSESLDLPAGPYLRVEGTGVRIDIAGQRASADVVLEKATVGAETSSACSSRTRAPRFGDGTTNFVTLSGGSGFLVLRTGAASPASSAATSRSRSRASASRATSRSRSTTRRSDGQRDDRLRPGAGRDARASSSATSTATASPT